MCINNIYLLGKQIVGVKQFESFLSDVNNDFVPPLLERINFNEYFYKLRDNAVFSVCFNIDNARQLVGLVAGYCNDHINNKAYITFVAVKNEYRGNGIAGKLINIFVEYCKKEGISEVEIETNNVKVLKLYIKLGFKIESEKVIPNMQLVRYKLKMLL